MIASHVRVLEQRDIARDLELTQSGEGYYILDGVGGLHIGGDALPFAVPFFGWDVATSLEISPQSLAQLKGRVLSRNASGGIVPVSRALITLIRDNLPRGAIQIQSSGSPSDYSQGTIRVRCNSSGDYQINPLPAGNYRVLIRGTGCQPYEGEVEVSSGNATVQDFLLFATDAVPEEQGFGSIRGTVVEKSGSLEESAPIAYAKVVLRISNRNTLIARTGESGEFGFQNVPEGTYPIEAHSDGYYPAGTEITIAAAQESNVAFELSRQSQDAGVC